MSKNCWKPPRQTYKPNQYLEIRDFQKSETESVLMDNTQLDGNGDTWLINGIDV